MSNARGGLSATIEPVRGDGESETAESTTSVQGAVILRDLSAAPMGSALPTDGRRCSTAAQETSRCGPVAAYALRCPPSAACAYNIHYVISLKTTPGAVNRPITRQVTRPPEPSTQAHTTLIAPLLLSTPCVVALGPSLNPARLGSLHLRGQQ